MRHGKGSGGGAGGHGGGRSHFRSDLVYMLLLVLAFVVWNMGRQHDSYRAVVKTVRTHQYDNARLLRISSRSRRDDYGSGDGEGDGSGEDGGSGAGGGGGGERTEEGAEGEDPNAAEDDETAEDAADGSDDEDPTAADAQSGPSEAELAERQEKERQKREELDRTIMLEAIEERREEKKLAQLLRLARQKSVSAPHASGEHEESLTPRQARRRERDLHAFNLELAYNIRAWEDDFEAVQRASRELKPKRLPDGTLVSADDGTPFSPEDEALLQRAEEQAAWERQELDRLLDGTKLKTGFMTLTGSVHQHLYELERQKRLQEEEEEAARRAEDRGGAAGAPAGLAMGSGSNDGLVGDASGSGARNDGDTADSDSDGDNADAGGQGEDSDGGDGDSDEAAGGQDDGDGDGSDDSDASDEAPDDDDGATASTDEGAVADSASSEEGEEDGEVLPDEVQEEITGEDVGEGGDEDMKAASAVLRPARSKLTAAEADALRARLTEVQSAIMKWQAGERRRVIVLGESGYIGRDIVGYKWAFERAGFTIKKAKSGHISIKTLTSETWSVLLCLALNTEHCFTSGSMFKTQRYQRINRLQGLRQVLWSKDSFCRTLHEGVHGHASFRNYTFDCWILPKQYGAAQDFATAHPNEKYILKPLSMGGGIGIFVVDNAKSLHRYRHKTFIVQTYLQNPHLIKGRKWDLRTYVLVTSVYPLRVYLYHKGLVRFASKQYDPNAKKGGKRSQFLTNTSVNKHYSKHGVKDITWSFKELQKFFDASPIKYSTLLSRMRAAISIVFLSAEKVCFCVSFSPYAAAPARC